MPNSYYEKTINELILPVLKGTSYTRYIFPKGWMCPEFLFINTHNFNYCFEITYDEREYRIEAIIGKPILYKDCLPRIILAGQNIVNSSSMKSLEYKEKIKFIRSNLVTLLKTNGSTIKDEIQKEINRIKSSEYFLQEINSKEELNLCIINNKPNLDIFKNIVE